MKPLYEARRAGGAIFQRETLGAFWQKPRVYVKSATRPQVRLMMVRRDLVVKDHGRRRTLNGLRGA